MLVVSVACVQKPRGARDLLDFAAGGARLCGCKSMHHNAFDFARI
jgi:hypothetical protein